MRNASGTVFQASSGRWGVRVSLPGGKRKAVTMPGLTEAQATERGAVIADFVKRLRTANHNEVLLGVIEQAAAASEVELVQILAAVAKLESKPQPLRPKPIGTPSFIDFAELWSTGKLHAQWPDHVPLVKHARVRVSSMRLNLPEWFLQKPITEISLDDCDRVLACFNKDLQGSTRRGYAIVVHRILSLAHYPARVIASNPIPKGWLPNAGPTKALNFLYPSEDAALLACQRVSLDNRLFYGFLCREGLRHEEARQLRVSDLDLVRGTVRLDKNKTDDPRVWVLDPGVKRGLATFIELRKLKPNDKVFKPHRGKHPATLFRSHLRFAGVTRAELFESSKVRRPIRIHDARATFVTLSLASDRTETWVCDRTGHKSSGMLNRYRRLARTAAELSLGWLAPLDEAIPELRQAGKASGETPAQDGTTGGQLAIQLAMAEARIVHDSAEKTIEQDSFAQFERPFDELSPTLCWRWGIRRNWVDFQGNWVRDGESARAGQVMTASGGCVDYVLQAPFEAPPPGSSALGFAPAPVSRSGAR